MTRRSKWIWLSIIGLIVPICLFAFYRWSQLPTIPDLEPYRMIIEEADGMNIGVNDFRVLTQQVESNFDGDNIDLFNTVLRDAFVTWAVSYADECECILIIAEIEVSVSRILIIPIASERIRFIFEIQGDSVRIHDIVFRRLGL